MAGGKFYASVSTVEFPQNVIANLTAFLGPRSDLASKVTVE